LSGSEKKQGDTGRRDETEREGGWQGVSESAVSAKRFSFLFGAKPAQSETPVRAAAKRASTRKRSAVEMKMRSLPLALI